MCDSWMVLRSKYRKGVQKSSYAVLLFRTRTSEVLKEPSGNEIGSKQQPNAADKSVAGTSEVCSFSYLESTALMHLTKRTSTFPGEIVAALSIAREQSSVHSSTRYPPCRASREKPRLHRRIQKLRLVV